MYNEIIKKLDNRKIPVLVVANNVGSLGIIYPLLKNNMDVIGISNESYLISSLGDFGIYIEDKYRWIDEIIKIGYEYKKYNQDKKIVFLTDGDLIMDQMVEKFDIIKDLFILPIDNNVSGYLDATNKDFLLNSIKNTRLPKTYKGDEQYKVDEFPVLSKQISSYYRKPKEKVLVSNNREELKNNLEKLSSIGGSVTQEIIEGSTENLYCITLYRNKYGYIIIGNLVQKKRELPIVNGTGSCHESIYNEEILNKAIEIINEIGYIGVAMIELKYSHKYKEYVLIEINGRFPIETNINSKLENEFIENIYKDMINPKDSKEVLFKNKDKKAYWVLKSYDIRACLKKKINPFREYKKHKDDIVDAVKDYNESITYSTYKKNLMKKVLKKIKICK